MIDYFTGPARVENKERCRKYFTQFDANGDGVLQRDEVDAAVAGICDAFLMQPPECAKIDALFAKTDQNGDGVLTISEWSRLYKVLVQNALQQATVAVEQQKKKLKAAAAAAWASQQAVAWAKMSDDDSQTPTRGRGPPKATTKGRQQKATGISVWTVDMRGEACDFRYECAVCKHTWRGMGTSAPKTMACPGCGKTLSVTNKGWG